MTRQLLEQRAAKRVQLRGAAAPSGMHLLNFGESGAHHLGSRGARGGGLADERAGEVPRRLERRLEAMHQMRKWLGAVDDLIKKGLII